MSFELYGMLFFFRMKGHKDRIICSDYTPNGVVVVDVVVTAFGTKEVGVVANKYVELWCIMMVKFMTF